MPKVVVIGGPTAVGKSKLSLALMNQHNGVLVNADATKLYKGLSCGANKTPLNGVGVRLWDVVHASDASAEFSSGQFHDLAVSELRKIIEEEHKLPIVVGGSGLYLRWLLRGKQAGPRRDDTRSRQILAEISSLSWDEVKSRISSFDAVYANKLGANDYRRAARAIELNESTGKILSDLQRQRVTALHDESATNLSSSTESPSDSPHLGPVWQNSIDFRPFVVSLPRQQLYDTICRRCENMILDGLFSEVWSLMRQGLTANSTPGKAIGYRQTIDYLNARHFTEDSFMHFLLDFQSKTRQLAHRQLAWFRKEPDFLNVNLSATTAQEIGNYLGMSREDWLAMLKEQHIPTEAELHAEAAPLRHYLPPKGLLILPTVNRKERTLDYLQLAQERQELINRQLSILDNILYEMNRIGFPKP